MKWGDFPSWIAAIGTAGALIAATYSIAIERVARRADRREAQARLVDVWVDKTSLSSSTEVGFVCVLKVAVRLANTSGQSVRGFDVDLWGSGDEYFGRFLCGVVPPRPPGQERVVELSVGVRSGSSDANMPAEYWKIHLRVAIVFTDSSGNRWYRSPDGLLRCAGPVRDRTDGPIASNQGAIRRVLARAWGRRRRPPVNPQQGG